MHLPPLTDRFDGLDGFTPEPHSVYVFATSPEQRSAHSPEWEAKATDVTFVRLHGERDMNADFDVADGDGIEVALRSGESLSRFWERFGGRSAYIDITGLGHHLWAPLLRSALERGVEVRVVYVEPVDYKQSATPTEGEIFDLSEQIAGIAPIPGFASLAEDDGGEFLLVALLGFEGPRFAHVLESVQPLGGKVVPFVGAPGFRAEYPFYTYHGNKAPLVESRAWTRVMYVTANCPFSVFRLLDVVSREYAGPLKIAPIGTKPHALGAVLFAIAHEASVELVYDHPIKTPKRTVGSARALVYHVSPLMSAMTV